MEYNNPNDYWNGYDPMNGMSDGERMLAGCLQCGLLIVVAFVGMLLAALLSGCTKTEYVTVEKVRTDTLQYYCSIRDSVYLHDSTFIREKGDTVWIEKWHTKWRERLVHDTCYQSRTDTLVSVTEHVKEVAKPLTWWQRSRIFVGGLVIFGAIVLLCWKYLVPLARKFI